MFLRSGRTWKAASDALSGSCKIQPKRWTVVKNQGSETKKTNRILTKILKKTDFRRGSALGEDSVCFLGLRKPFGEPFWEFFWLFCRFFGVQKVDRILVRILGAGAVASAGNADPKQDSLIHQR
jgi:hypothetical protein